MTRTLTEQKVLKKLGITDFRHMTKDKVVRFASMLPYMDAEVAKKALEQFPAFKELATELATQYKSVVDKALSGNESSQKEFYNACDLIIQSLQDELKEADTQEDRERIEDKMILVATMMRDKDTENKAFLMKCLGVCALVITVVGGTAAAILGVNTQAKQDDVDGNMDDSSDEE